MAKNQYWNNKTILVTGGSSGIGLLLTTKLPKRLVLSVLDRMAASGSRNKK